MSSNMKPPALSRGTSLDAWGILDKLSGNRTSFGAPQRSASFNSAILRSNTSMSDPYDDETIDYMMDALDEMACTQADVPDLIDDDNFRQLQQSLRNRGCVTNTYIQQNMHKYVKHVRSVKEAKIRASFKEKATRMDSNAAA